MEIIFSFTGAINEIIVAVLSYKHNNEIQILKLKKNNYISYIQSLNNL